MQSPSFARPIPLIGTLGKVVLTKPEQIHKYFEAVLKAFDRLRTVALDGSEALAVDDNTGRPAGFDTLRPLHSRRSRLRNEFLKIIKEPRLKA